MNATFVRTNSVLDRILAHKQEEVDAARSARPLSRLVEECAGREPPRDLVAALKRKTVALIAECKQASPSKGRLSDDYDPVRLARVYAASGAAAISVLTDAPFLPGQPG